MSETDATSPPADNEVPYPKPKGWEHMTHDERYAALGSKPKPDSAALRHALLNAKQEVLREQGDKKRAFQEARRADILADAPHFTVTLRGSPSLSLSKSCYPITASLTYILDPATSAASTHVSRPVLLRPSYGPLSTSAPNENLYSIYTTPTCAPGSRIPHVRPNASMRPPREPDGSFTKEMTVTSWDEWEEVDVGDTVTREVTIGLDERSGWRKHLEIGKSYWLRCDDVGLLGSGRLGLDRYWRSGRKDDVELPMRIQLRDPQVVSIPLEPSNMVEFVVVE